MSMGRSKRADVAGHCYHMLNRANLRETIFRKPEDYDAFEKNLCEAIDRFDVRIFSYCIMPNHWHFVVSPGLDGEMGRFGHWVGLTHTQRHHAHYRTAGMGHLYQGRYKSFPVQSNEHFLTVCRYTERNAFHAELCTSPELWKWGSLHHWSQRTPIGNKLLSPWPIPRRPNWIGWVTTDFSKQELEQLHWSVKRGVPFGDGTWVEHIVRKYDLESTMRPRGRPKKQPD